MTEEEVKLLIEKYVKKECLIDRYSEVGEILKSLKRDNDYEIDDFYFSFSNYDDREQLNILVNIKGEEQSIVSKKYLDMQKYYKSKMMDYNIRFSGNLI